MNVTRWEATATLLPNGNVLIAGGQGGTGFAVAPLASVDLYDPTTNSFAPAGATPTMNQPRWGATATLLNNGQVLIAGGQNSTAGVLDTGILNNVELYDPATNTFAPGASLPTMNTARTGATAVLLFNGKVLIAGGEGPSPIPPFSNVVSLNSVELYDPATNSFAPANSLPTMTALRDGCTGTLLSNGKVLIAGGVERFVLLVPTISNTGDLYDPVTNSFAPAASLPTMNATRAFATATLLPGGEVLIAGGETPNIDVLGIGITTLASVDLYDPVTNSFAPAASTPLMNQARQGATATLLNNGLVLVAGGVDNQKLPNESTDVSTLLASVDLYDPVTNSFAPAASTPLMNQARQGATATLLGNGKVLIAGGSGSGYSVALSSTELYTPANTAP